MAKIGSIKMGISGEQLISGLPVGTLVRYSTGSNECFCIWAWAGLMELNGERFWSKEIVEKLKMHGTILPSGTIVEVIQS